MVELSCPLIFRVKHIRLKVHASLACLVNNMDNKETERWLLLCNYAVSPDGNLTLLNTKKYQAASQSYKGRNKPFMTYY